jgi:hypothetical protein
MSKMSHDYLKVKVIFNSYLGKRTSSHGLLLTRVLSIEYTTRFERGEWDLNPWAILGESNLMSGLIIDKDVTMPLLKKISQNFWV